MKRCKYFLSDSKTTFNDESYKNALKHKKVMLPLDVNNYSRLDHTRDVSKIAIKISNHLKKNFSLSLNANKLETMVDWHDVGHCPYAHAGEETLNRLLAEEGNFYHDTFYSGYKHNLLSAKILLDENVNISWDIIDAIIKHSSCLPSNFNISRVSEYNLLKLNYIFRQKSNNNNSWNLFISTLFNPFPCDDCTTVKQNMSNVVENNKFSICIHHNKQNKFCCLQNSTHCKNGLNISRYLLYPYSLTFEGACLFWADEIACLTNDLYYYYQYVESIVKGSKQYIIKSKIDNAINILKVTYSGNKIAQNLFFHIDSLLNGISTSKNQEYLSNIQDILIKDIIVQKYETVSTIDEVSAYKATNSFGECTSLLSLSDAIFPAFSELKRAIYEIIHKDSCIVKDNTTGEKRLENLFSYYYENPDIFFEIPDNKNLIMELKQIIAQTGRFQFLNGKIEDEIYNAKKHNEIVLSMKILNAFRREIVFYLAKLKENNV